MSSRNFAIVLFMEEEEAPGIVPAKLITKDGDYCFYPNVGSEDMKCRLLKKMADPKEFWPKYKIKILKSYETYSEARLHLKKAEETSNLESEEEDTKRKITIKKIYSPEESDSDEPPTLKRKKIKEINRPPTPPKRSSSTGNEFTDKLNESEKITTTKSNPPEKCPYGCVTSKKIAMQLIHITQVTTDLSNQLNQINKKIDFLLARKEGPILNEEYSAPEFLKHLPVMDFSTFSSLNEKLKEEQNKQAIIKYLAGIGGKDLRTFTTNMLRRIIGDEVAQNYSLTGRKMSTSNKKSFIETEICKVIFHICRNFFEDSTEEKIKEIISDWLNQAKFRITRRANRQNSSANESI